MLYKIRRLFRILRVLIHNDLDQALIPRYLSPSFLLSLFKQRQKRLIGERCFHACSELGPLFVKMGQLISIRHDLFDEALTTPLAKLQDNVPPYPTTEAHQLITNELKKPLSELFSSIEDTPMASASIAQVYAARLKTGDDIVIKVLRPNIKNIVTIDLAVLRSLTKVLCFFKSLDKKPLLALIDEYAHTIYQEINLMNEACHYSQMAHHFEHDSRLHVPKVYWSHTTESVLTLERVYGTPIDQIDHLPQESRATLAKNGVSIFFTQVFKHRFFHADMHPGNVFIDDKDPYNPRYMAVDFGIVGVISPQDQYYLAESFLGFYHRDYTRIAKLHIEAGWVSSDTDLVKFECAIRHVCEPIFARTIEEISIAELMHRLVEIAKPFDLNLQPQLLMLQKTLFHVEALGRQLYPKLNLWDAAEPFLSEFMRHRSSRQEGWKHLKQELPRLITHSPQLPYLVAQKLKSPTPSHTIPHTQSYSSILFGVLIGALLFSPDKLTNPGFIYILSVSLIITIAWKHLK